MIGPTVRLLAATVTAKVVPVPPALPIIWSTPTSTLFEPEPPLNVTTPLVPPASMIPVVPDAAPPLMTICPGAPDVLNMTLPAVAVRLVVSFAKVTASAFEPYGFSIWRSPVVVAIEPPVSTASVGVLMVDPVSAETALLTVKVPALLVVMLTSPPVEVTVPQVAMEPLPVDVSVFLMVTSLLAVIPPIMRLLAATVIPKVVPVPPAHPIIWSTPTSTLLDPEPPLNVTSPFVPPASMIPVVPDAAPPLMTICPGAPACVEYRHCRLLL